MRGRPIKYIAAIDDSGIPKPPIDWAGNFIPADKPYVGLAAVLLPEAAIAEFNGRWTHLRQKIQRKLGAAEPPEIHMRMMWGKNVTSKRKPNPFANAEFRQIKGWLTEARNILQSVLQHSDGAGIYTDFISREEFAKNLSPYFTDPEFADDHQFFRAHKTKGKTGKLYDTYHTITTSALIRFLPTLLWHMDDEVAQVHPDAELTVLVDRFSGADSVDEQAVLAASRQLAGLKQITSLTKPDSTGSPALLQAADVVAYSFNRFINISEGHTKPDPHFVGIFAPLIEGAKSLQGASARGVLPTPAETVKTTLCIVYALARHELSERDPSFVEANLISVEEFHSIVSEFGPQPPTGIHIFKDGIIERGYQK